MDVPSLAWIWKRPPLNESRCPTTSSAGLPSRSAFMAVQDPCNLLTPSSPGCASTGTNPVARVNQHNADVSRSRCISLSGAGRQRSLRYFLRKVAVTRETTLGREAVHTRQKPLQASKIRFALPRHQFVAILLPRGVPPLRNHFRRRCHILARQQREFRTVDEPFVLSRRHEEIPPDRTTDGQFLLRH